MTMASSPSYLLQVPILFTSLVDGLLRMSAPLILSLSPHGSAVPNSLINSSSTLSRSGFANLVLPNFLCTFSRICTFISNVKGLATESVDKQVYHQGWHHYDGHSCVGEANNQFHQHTIINTINK